MKPEHLVAIAVGGVLGAATRWAVVEVLPAGRLAVGVLVANTAGSFLVGVVAALALHPERRNHPVTLAAGAGFCGSLTTFSTLAVSVANELRDQRVGDGVAMLAVAVAAGLAAAWAGWHLIETTVHRSRPLR